MSFARPITVLALCLLVLVAVPTASAQQETWSETPAELKPANETEWETMMQTTTSESAASQQIIEQESSAPEERRFYRKGEEYEQAKEPEVILPTEPEPVAPATPIEVVPEVTEEQTHSAAPAVMEETPESESMEPAATEQSGGIVSQLLSGTLPWLMGAVAIGGVATVFFLRKKKGLSTQIAAEQIAPPPPTQEQQASKRLEAAMKAMHAAETPTPAAGSDAPAA